MHALICRVTHTHTDACVFFRWRGPFLHLSCWSLYWSWAHSSRNYPRYTLPAPPHASFSPQHPDCHQISRLTLMYLYVSLLQAVLATIVFVNLKGMFKQYMDIPALWKSNKVDLVRTAHSVPILHVIKSKHSYNKTTLARNPDWTIHCNLCAQKRHTVKCSYHTLWSALENPIERSRNICYCSVWLPVH